MSKKQAPIEGNVIPAKAGTSKHKTGPKQRQCHPREGGELFDLAEG